MILRTRLLLTFGVGSLVFIFAIALLVFSRMETVMSEQLHQQFRIDANSRINSLNKSFGDLTGNFEHTAELPIFNSMNFHELTLNTAALKNDIRQLELYFFKLIKKRSEISRIQYLSNNGGEILRIEPTGIKKNLSDLSQTPAVKNVIAQSIKHTLVTEEKVAGKRQNIVWWIPVYADNLEPLGILTFSVSMDYFLNAIESMANSKTEATCLRNTTGIAIFTGNDETVCQELKSEELHQQTGWKISQEVNLPNLAWRLVLSTDPKYFLTDVEELKVLVFGKIFTGTALFALIFTLFFTTRITNTISQLANAARTMGLGEKLPPMDIQRNDELGVLAKEMKRSAKLIEGHRKTLETKNRDMEAYSYTLAHDLRSPLRSITSFSQILEMDAFDKLNDEEKDSLTRIINASKRMSTLINDILELSRISNREIRMQEISLTSVANSFIETLRTTESDTQRKVDVAVEHDMMTEGDPQLIRLVLENLIGNAWKYSRHTEKAKISFGSKVVEQKKLYYIKDNGAGFDMQYANKLFKPFQRLHKKDEFEGTGIGLASVKRMIERHNGQVWIQSAVNIGTTVFFTLNELPSDKILNVENPID